MVRTSAVISLGLCLVLAACGSSSSSGTTVVRHPPASRIALLEHDLERQYGLNRAHCEQDVHGHVSDHFICLAYSESLLLQLAVTQAKPDERPLVTACEGARKIRGKPFLTCEIKPGAAG